MKYLLVLIFVPFLLIVSCKESKQSKAQTSDPSIEKQVKLIDENTQLIYLLEQDPQIYDGPEITIENIDQVRNKIVKNQLLFKWLRSAVKEEDKELVGRLLGKLEAEITQIIATMKATQQKMKLMKLGKSIYARLSEIKGKTAYSMEDLLEVSLLENSIANYLIIYEQYSPYKFNKFEAIAYSDRHEYSVGDTVDLFVGHLVSDTLSPVEVKYWVNDKDNAPDNANRHVGMNHISIPVVEKGVNNVNGFIATKKNGQKVWLKWSSQFEVK